MEMKRTVGNGKLAKGLKIPWTEFKKVSTENLYTALQWLSLFEAGVNTDTDLRSLGLQRSEFIVQTLGLLKVTWPAFLYMSRITPRKDHPRFVMTPVTVMASSPKETVLGMITSGFGDDTFNFL